MSSKVKNGYDRVGDSRSGELLLRDIEAISKALYLDKTPSRGLPQSTGKTTHFQDVRSISKSTVLEEQSSRRGRKSSIWNWKPLKALTHIRNRRFNCCFFLHVHSIQGLPPSFKNFELRVHWKRKEELQTCPSRVCHGAAEFEETLMHRCAVYGSRSGPRQTAKYEAKHFLLYTSVVEAPGLDIGRHSIDLTEFLPPTFEELEEDKRLGKWATSFKLSGKATGAVLNVSFGFLVTGDNLIHLTSNLNVPELLNSSQNRLSSVRTGERSSSNGGSATVRKIGNTSSVPNCWSHVSPPPVVMPNSGFGLSKSIGFLYEKLDERTANCAAKFDLVHEDVKSIKAKACPSSESGKEFVKDDCDDIEFVIIDRGIELPTKEHLKSEESAAQTFCFAADHAAKHCSKDEIYKNQRDDVVVGNNEHMYESSMEELDPTSHDLDLLPAAISDFLEQENPKCDYETSRIMRSSSLDVVTESVACDFLNMLEEEHFEPESPRECLLKQFENDIAAFGMSILGLDDEGESSESGSPRGSKREEFSEYFDFSPAAVGTAMEGFDFPPVIEVAKAEHKGVHPSLRSKRSVKVLEDLEPKSFRQDWSLKTEAFENSARFTSGGFGSPIYLPPEELHGSPPQG